MRMKLMNGCSDDEITFEDVVSGTLYRHTPPSRDACKIFHPDGGGVSSQVPVSGFDFVHPAAVNGNAHYFARTAFIKGVGDDYVSDLMIVTIVPEEMCTLFYQKNGISGGLVDHSMTNTTHQGVFPVHPADFNSGGGQNSFGYTGGSTVLAGHDMACYRPTLMYFVVLAR